MQGVRENFPQAGIPQEVQVPDRENFKKASGRTEGIIPVYNLPQMVQECWKSQCIQIKNPWTKMLMMIAPSKGRTRASNWQCKDRTGQDRTGVCANLLCLGCM